MEKLKKIIKDVVSSTYLTENQVKRFDFAFQVPENIIILNTIFKENNFELFIVGGAVRDMILGKEPKDFDLVSDASPDEVETFLEGKFKTIDTGKAFGVTTVVMPDKEVYEIARYREDLGSGRRPENGVKFSTIDVDVMRRDLTINALYYDIDKKQIIDFVGGYEDIIKKRIRTVGSATDRFEEDQLRILRAIRFAARFDSNLDDDIVQALQKNNSLKGVSEERIRDEFIKGIQSAKFPQKYLILLDNFGLLTQILKGLEYNKKDFINNNDYIITIANLIKTNPVNTVKKELLNLKYSNKNKEIAKIAFLLYIYNFKPQQVVTLKKLEKISQISPEQIMEFAKINNLNTSMIKKFIDFKFSVNSKELMDQGFKGEELGAEIENREIENFLNS